MGQHYDQLSLDERCEIARLHAAGTSIRKIAAALGRPPSTVSREVKRNSGRDTGYRPALAQDKTAARRWNGSKLDRDEALRDQVLALLARGWSPEQVAGRLKADAGCTIISHETIYRFIHAQIRRTNDGAWRHYLPQARYRRGRRRRKGGSSARTFKNRVSIDARPASVASRRTCGHWEADLMAFSKYNQNILVAHERRSRFLLIARQPDKRAATVVRQLTRWLAPLPPKLRRSVTFDNGTEFAEHWRLNDQPGARTYFCDPHSPWQKGGVENAIGRMRRPLPRKTDLAVLPLKAIQAAVDRYNATPRKCLGWKTPAEAFSQHIKPLHFKCESTSRLSPGRAE
jgi:IS30 family transposase